MAKPPSSVFSERFSRINWTFEDLVNSGVHALHWYPAAYISAIPGTLIPHLTEPDAIVLDPFMGAGTTGVEAVRLGRRFVGVDTNPVAAMIAQCKLLFVSKQEALETDRDLRRTLEDWAFPRLQDVPEHPARDWYHPETFQQLRLIYSYVAGVRNVRRQQLLFTIFSSILIACTSQQKHWGWVCDNVRPRKLVYVDAFGAFFKALESAHQAFADFERDVHIFLPEATPKELRGRVSITLGDAEEAMRAMSSETIDCVMTSPPYYGVADYVKAHRLTFQWVRPGDLAWFGGSWASFQQLRRREVGARSFRHSRGSYTAYVEYLGAFLREAARVLKRNGFLVLVFGASTRRKDPADDVLRHAADCGFSISFVAPRSIPANHRRLMAQVPEERVYVCTRAV